ncbi:MAG: carbohydrate kinase [Silicimonas sp.]|nr:carbohydrate kinase [Silicimonas sp.]
MILCAGEALIDMLPRKSAAGEQTFAPYPGGAVFNTAIALGRLEAPVGFFSGISTDLFGDILIRSLGGAGVDSSFAHRSDRPTTLAFVTLKDGHASYAFYDENTAGRMLSESDLPRVNDEVEAMFFGGISLVVEPCAAAYEALIKREAGHRVVMIDPNIRPGFIKDEESYRARLGRMIGKADIVKVSDEDLTWLLGEGDIDALARQLLITGPSLVCVTEGAKGVRGFTSAGVVTVSSRKVAVVDTVGAGDTFNAGLLAALHERGVLSKDRIRSIGADDVEMALSLGSRAAAVTVSRAGANPPRRDEL